MNEVSKVELNSIIECLIDSSGSDEEANLILARFATDIRSETGVSVNVSGEMHGGSFSGYTPDNGTVNVQDDSKQKKAWSIGDRSQRVGYYKISKKTYRRAFFWVNEERIIITHFWKADTGTESETEEPEAWCLSCNSRMVPVWFGRFASIELLRFGTFALVFRWILETWGGKPGSMHPDNVSVRIHVQI